jgi:hypothetical protein
MLAGLCVGRIDALNKKDDSVRHFRKKKILQFNLQLKKRRGECSVLYIRAGRKLPMAYSAFEWLLFVYFSTHIPITILIDTQSVYPWIWPEDNFFRQLGENNTGSWCCFLFFFAFFLLFLLVLDHVKRNEDLLIDAQKSWFVGIATAECLLQLPFFFWALFCLWTRRASLNAKLSFICYGVHTATTLIPQFFEMWHFNGFGVGISQFNRAYLTCLYGIYFVVPLCIIIKFWRSFDNPWSAEPKKRKTK